MGELKVAANPHILNQKSNAATTLVNGGAFHTFLQGFAQQANSPEEQLENVEVTDSLLEEHEIAIEETKVSETAEMPETAVGEVEDNETEEATEPSTNNIAVEVPPLVDTQEAIKQASFFNPVPLRNVVAHDTTVEQVADLEVATSEKVEGLTGTAKPIQTDAMNVDAKESQAKNTVAPTQVVETASKVQAVSGTAVTETVVKETKSKAGSEPVAVTSTATTTVAIPAHFVPEGLSVRPMDEKVTLQVAEKLTQPIVEKVTTMSSGSMNKVTVELLPEHLGKVEVTIQVTNDKVQLEFVVQNNQTRQLLETVKPRLEQIIHKQEFSEVLQGKSVESAPVVTHDLSQSSFSEQSNFQQGFQQERRQQNLGQQGNKQKTFAEVILEKEVPIQNGSVDILA